MRTAGREEEKKGWTVATSEVSMCCGAKEALGSVAFSLDYSGQGHMWVWAAHGVTGIFSLVGEAGAESPPRSFFSVSSSLCKENRRKTLMNGEKAQGDGWLLHLKPGEERRVREQQQGGGSLQGR